MRWFPGVKHVSLGLKYLSYPIILIAFFVCWRIESENARLVLANQGLQARQHEILASANSPIMIRGLTVPLLDQMDTIEQHRITDESASGRQLILIYRTGCSACEQQALSWASLVADRRLRHVETWLVSLGNGRGEMQPVLDVLRKSDVPYRVLEVRKVEPFVVRTGLRAVPVTLVTRGEGPESVVEFIQQGLADQSRLDLLLEAISQKPGAQGARIGPDAQMDPL